MKLLVSTLIFLLAVCATAARAPAQGWKDIIPLHSTRADVGRSLGKPVDPGKKGSAVYDLQNEIVLIFFTSGPPCSSSNAWRVGKGVVVDITITPKKRLTLSEMNIDVSTYEKTVDPHPPSHTKYTDTETGQSIVVSGEEVQFLTFSPAAKDRHLRCRSAAITPPADESGQYAHTLDTYGDIPFVDEKRHLNNFALQLRLNQDTVGYITYYWGNRREVASSRASRARRYLIREHNVDPRRVTLREGGRAKIFAITFGILPTKISSRLK